MSDPLAQPRFSTWPTMGLPAGYFRMSDLSELAAFYRREGFAVVLDAFAEDEVDLYRREAAAVCRGDRGEIPGLVAAVPGESDDAVLQRHLCIHFPNKASQVFRDQISADPLIEILTAVIGPNVKCMQQMLFIKSSGKPGQAWHQDEDYIPTRDRSLTGAWLAMDDATVENGCLWVIPGSQQPGILWPQSFHNNRDFDCSWESHSFPYSDADAVPVEVPAGALVLFNGYLLHRSLPNRSSGYRRALVNHYMSAESLLPWLWPSEPTGMATHDHRDIILVAGTDPYAYRGVTDVMQPHVRPDGKGGCQDWSSETE